MKELTQRQREVLSFITEYIEAHAYPPTIREVADFFSISVKGAYDHVSALKKKGRLKLGDKRSRAMEVIRLDSEERSDPTVEIPILGTVAAGRPILSEENWDGTLHLHSSMLKKSADFFALRVRGDSMEGAGIMDGDLAVIEKQETARDGDIVVALMEDSVTLKRFFKESTRVRLQPENPAYHPMYTQDVKILGKLAHIMRSYH